MRKTICLCLFFISIQAVQAQTDSVKLVNGDVIVGSVEHMEKGVLTFSTDYSDSDFKIEWHNVIELHTPKKFLIALNNGMRLNAIMESEGDRKLKLTDDDVIVHIEHSDIIYIEPASDKFISRFNASIDFGYNFTRSQKLQSFTMRSSVGYLANTWSANISFDGVRSSQEETETIRRNNLTLNLMYFLKNNWFLMFSSELLQNDEQLLALRATNRGGLGKYIIKTNQVYWGVATGIGWNNERFTTEEPEKNSAEAFVGTALNMFNTGDIKVQTNLTAYPSLTDSDRIRVDFKFDVSYDLPLDFYVKLGFTNNFDSQPTEGAVKNDYVLQTSFGWEL